MIELVLIIAFGLLMAMLMVVPAWFVRHRDFLVGIPERIWLWLEVAKIKPSDQDLEVSYSHSFRDALKYRTAQLGSEGGKAASGFLGRVHVSLDTIARVDQEDRFEKTRYLDSSRFCFSLNEATAVWCLARGKRLNIEFNTDPFHTQAALLTCQVAVHLSVDLDLGSAAHEASLNELFSMQETLLPGLIRSFVRRVLSSQLKGLTYDQAMVCAPELIEKLNSEWQKPPEADTRDLRSLVRVEFTALMFDALRRFEEMRMSGYYHELKVLDEQIHGIHRELEAVENGLSGPRAKLDQKLLDDLEALEAIGATLTQEQVEIKEFPMIDKDVIKNVIKQRYTEDPGGFTELIASLEKTFTAVNQQLEKTKSHAVNAHKH